MGLDLKGIVSGAVKTVFDLTTDAQKTATLITNLGTATYNVGTNSYSGGTKSSIITGLFYQSKEQQMSEDSSQIATFLLQGADLIALGLTKVSEKDRLVIDGVTWQIELVIPDPVVATWKLMLRK